VSDLPPDVRALLEERSSARAARDWERADALRQQLHELGWEPQDAPGGTTARPMLPTEPTSTGYARPEDLASLLDDPATVDASLQLLAEDYPNDLGRFLRGLASHPAAASIEVVVVANAPSFDVEALLAETGRDATVLPTSERLGWADARNLGLRRSSGEITILLDTSVEPTGDFVAPLLTAFGDAHVGIAGGWGVRSDDGREFHTAPAGEVDAIEGYCLAIRRAALRQVSGFDHRFRYYRNADLDLSFAVRDRGWRALATDPLPLVRHEHRGYEEVAPDDRDRLSRRNFYRFLKHWGDRRDLLLARRDDA
jgi:cysteinyl-tRNA synthetase